MRPVLWGKGQGQDRLARLAPSTKRALRKALDDLRRTDGTQFGRLPVKELDIDHAVPLHRMKVGEWRIAFTVEGKAVKVARVFHRSEGYAWLGDL